jgi:hypothetical protein
MFSQRNSITVSKLTMSVDSQESQSNTGGMTRKSLRTRREEGNSAFLNIHREESTDSSGSNTEGTGKNRRSPFNRKLRSKLSETVFTPLYISYLNQVYAQGKSNKNEDEQESQVIHQDEKSIQMKIRRCLACICFCFKDRILKVQTDEDDEECKNS